jgi:hypothetical protein
MATPPSLRVLSLSLWVLYFIRRGPSHRTTTLVDIGSDALLVDHPETWVPPNPLLKGYLYVTGYTLHARSILQPDATCWPLAGTRGNISLRVPAAVAGVRVRRAACLAAAAPREVVVWLDTEEVSCRVGSWADPPTDGVMHHVSATNCSMSGSPLLRLEIRSNWGHPDFTCIQQLQLFTAT